MAFMASLSGKVTSTSCNSCDSIDEEQKPTIEKDNGGLIEGPSFQHQLIELILYRTWIIIAKEDVTVTIVSIHQVVVTKTGM